jgi:hypothetical protein
MQIQKQNCNCNLISHGHFKFQCIKIERAQKYAEWVQREEKKAARNTQRTEQVAVTEELKTVVEPSRRPAKDEAKKLSSDLAIREHLSKKPSKDVKNKPVPKLEEPKKALKVQPTRVGPVEPREKTADELRRERGLAAWAKSCSGSTIQVQKDAFKITSKDKLGNAQDFSDTASTAASECEIEFRNSIIISLGLADKQEKELRKKLRSLYEIRVAEQTIALAEKQGKKTHPNLIAKVGRKTSLSADPLVQRFRRAGGSI